MAAESSFSELKMIYSKQFEYPVGPEMQSGSARWSAESKSWTLGALDDLAQCTALAPFKSVRRSATQGLVWDANSLGKLAVSVCYKYLYYKVGSKMR